MPILAVEPNALCAAGSAVVATGDGLYAAMTVLTAGFGANTGLDVAGLVFGLAYQETADRLLKLATAVINACRCNGVAIQVSASNYSKAEVASRLGGGGDALSVPGEPVRIGPPGSPGTLGPGEPPPLLWALVQSFVDDVWPDGDVAALRAAAGCWLSFGSAASAMQGELKASQTLIGTQQIPEGDQVNYVLSQIAFGIGKLGKACAEIGAAIADFAEAVSNAQNVIRDLLQRLASLTDLWRDVVLIFDGDALDEIKAIANDIKAVLHNLGREARALEQGAHLMIDRADGWIVEMEKHARRTITHFLGDQVGNPVATVFDTWVNANEGVGKAAAGALQSMVDLDPRMFVIDPEGAAATWKDMAKTGLLNSLVNPREAGEANLDLVKSLVHLDDWRRDRPGLGFGGLLFEGVMLSGGWETSAARGAGAAARAAEAGDAAGVMQPAARLENIARSSGALREIGKASGGLTTDLEDLKLVPPKRDLLPGGRPVGVPPEGNPIAVPRAVEPGSPGTVVSDSPTALHQKAVPGRLGNTFAPHELSPTSADVGHQPAPVRTPQNGFRVDSPSAGRAPQLTPPIAAPNDPVPHLSAPVAGRPPDLSTPGIDGWHGSGDDGPPGRGSRATRLDGDGLEPTGDGGPTGEAADSRAQPVPAKVPGVDYPLPVADVLRALEHQSPELGRLADGGIPATILEGYEPLAGRTVEEFKREFTVEGPKGETWWDWDGQAPQNGFAGQPVETDHIPADQRLDRIGPNGGGYLSPEGTPLPERATPPGLAAQYHLFEGTGRDTPPGSDWVVLHGRVKDAFGQPGGGEQWVVIERRSGVVVSVEELIEARMLRETRPGI
ncbi:TNT domain-containing protein [Mycobacterium sherrisii]|uniref:TNT domain-containing protein n=1 Tax=Mycobacterium sherrisii TaxID=243061 RepID=UPI0009FC6558|nr:TNT domain-containing protein [Mycobacterium sherrisii]